MGSRCAPSVACTFMAYFEHEYIQTYHTQPLLWKRFIDDCFAIWTHGIEALDAFTEHLNTSHPNIRFTRTHSTTHVEFLDTTVRITNHKLTPELYIKPTSSLSYLHRDSCHPRHVFESLPYGEFLRVRRNCSEEATFDSYALRIKQAFITRGYDETVLQTDLEKAKLQDRNELISNDRSSEPTPVPSTSSQANNEVTPAVVKPAFLVMTHHPANTQFKQIVKTNWDLLGSSETTTGLFNAGYKLGARRNPRLRDKLVSSSLPLPHKRGKQGMILNECEKAICIYCDTLDKSGQIQSFFTKQTHTSKFNICCQSSNLVYCLECRTCSKQYVGQTKRKFLERLREHFNNIRKNNQRDPIGRHFNSPHHDGKCTQVKTYILAFITMPSNSNEALHMRLKFERSWIYRLRTSLPYGLNSMD